MPKQRTPKENTLSKSDPEFSMVKNALGCSILQLNVYILWETTQVQFVTHCSLQ